jgi:hypothetical protein
MILNIVPTSLKPYLQPQTSSFVFVSSSKNSIYATFIDDSFHIMIQRLQNQCG